MKTRNLMWVTMAFMAIVGACNYTVGECWPVGQSDGPAGVGGSGVGVGGVGGYGFGDAPKSGGTGANACNKTDEKEQTPQPDQGGGLCGSSNVGGLVGADTYTFCSGPCESKCPPGGVGFSSSVFKFTTLVPDDGEDEAGGWQVTFTTLSFFRWTSVVPEAWKCAITIGMPLRTAVLGPVSPGQAASWSASAATSATFTLMHSTPELPPGIFCIRLPGEVLKVLKAEHPGLGPTVN